MFDEDEFRDYLRHARKKPNVIERNIKTIKHCLAFLQSNHIELSDLNEKWIGLYVEALENQNKSPKGYLYVLMNYFKFTGDKSLLTYTAGLRESYTKKSRKVFQMKDFKEVDSGYIARLNDLGIKNVNDMIREAKTPEQRKKLSQKSDIPEEEVLRLAQLADITWVGYIKSVLAPLYHAAGITSPEILAKYSADELHLHFNEFKKENDYPAQVPFLKDLEHNIKTAKKVKSKIEL